MLMLLLVCRMAAAVAALFQDVSVRFLEERTERALQRCAADSRGEQGEGEGIEVTSSDTYWLLADIFTLLMS